MSSGRGSRATIIGPQYINSPEERVTVFFERED